MLGFGLGSGLGLDCLGIITVYISYVFMPLLVAVAKRRSAASGETVQEF